MARVKNRQRFPPPFSLYLLSLSAELLTPDKSSPGRNRGAGWGWERMRPRSRRPISHGADLSGCVCVRVCVHITRRHAPCMSCFARCDSLGGFASAGRPAPDPQISRVIRNQLGRAIRGHFSFSWISFEMPHPPFFLSLCNTHRRVCIKKLSISQ